MRTKLRKVKTPIKRAVSALMEPDSRLSFAQCGEDLILEMAFSLLNIQKPYYLDLGAHHPTYLSNTYRFYRNGSRGVCVEADPELCAAFQKKRPRDACLNIGVTTGESANATFYVMSTRTLNTFSQAEAERYSSYGTHHVVRTVDVPVLNVNDIIAQHCERAPELVSLDIEGLDLAVLQSLDFRRSRPPVFCVETLTYTEDRTEQKIESIADLMSQAGYFVYADTYINTIFIDKGRWSAR